MLKHDWNWDWVSTFQVTLSLQVFSKTDVGEQVTAYFSFTNPLPVPLKDGVFALEESGLLHANTEVKYLICKNSIFPVRTLLDIMNYLAPSVNLNHHN